MINFLISLSLTITIFFSHDIYAQAENKLLIHVKTALDIDDAQICAVPNVAWAALKSGKKVTILFDASAVTSITKGWGWFNFGDSTPMDKAKLPERERKSLSEQFSTPLDEIPKNYGEYLGFIKDKGAKIFVNRTMMTLYNISPEEIDQRTEPISLEKMVNTFSKKSIYIVY